MSQFLGYALPGVPYGCAYALMAIGLVLTYRAAGVFNLAFGAQAYVSAVLYSTLSRRSWPPWAAFVVAVVLLGPALGVVLDRLLFRYTRTRPPLVSLVPALGLLIAVPSIVAIVFPHAARHSPAPFVLDPNRVYFHAPGFAVSGEEIVTTVTAVVIVGALAALMRWSRFGLRMRAVVESPRMAELVGVRADLVSTGAWVLSSLLAGVAGVLLAPIYQDLQPANFSALLVAAIAAAAVGGLVSLPWTLVGGVALGVAQQVIGGYLPSGSILSSGLRPAFPFVVLAVVLVARRGLRQPGGGSDPLAACDPPPPSFQPPVRPAAVTVGTRVVAGGAAAVLAASVASWLPGNWTFTVTQGAVFAVIFLSITLLTGGAGQISLCQATFAGVGAFSAGQLATHFGTPVLLGVVVGGLVGAATGALVALPTLHLGGIALALLTLAFALLADNVVFPYSWAGNGASGVSVPRPTLAGISFAGDRSFFWLAVAVLVLVAGAVALLRGGSFGQQLAAFRGSERGAEAVGIDLRRLRIVAFALAAAIAGVGGALYGSLQQVVSPNDFNYQLSLVFVVVVATVGVYSVGTAVEAGVAYAVLGQLVGTLPTRFTPLLALVFGLAALGYVRHPEGILAFAQRWVVDRFEQLGYGARHRRARGAFEEQC